MARLQSPRSASPRNGTPFDRSSAELAQLLSRLQTTVLHSGPEQERRLQRDEYERKRLGSNLEFARNSLSKLEHDALGILAPARRVEVQTDLNKKREVLELLMDKLEDIRKTAIDDDDGDSSEGEDILADIIPTPSESMASTNTDARENTPSETNTHELSIPEPPTPPEVAEPPPPPLNQELPTQTSQTLRSRSTNPTSPPSHATARAALFANRRKPSPTTASGPEASTATAEAILDQQAAEREDLAGKVFQMAQAMKLQQQSIHDSLEAEKEVLGRATEGMERTGVGMEATKGRMGALTRMTEGKGWWGRMILYAWVYGMMVALILLVFVMPKLRF